MESKTIKATELTSGMHLLAGFYGEFCHVTSVHYTSAHAFVVAVLDDGTKHYIRAHAMVIVRA